MSPSGKAADSDSVISRVQILPPQPDQSYAFCVAFFVISGSEPFEEMQGDVIVKYSGYVCKGGGSASGGDWIPKKPNDERFLGEPNTIKNNTVTTKNGNYK